MENRIIEKFRMPHAADKIESPRGLPRHKPGEKFIRGPIPLNWIETVGQLSGKTMSVAIAIWYLAGMNSGSNVIRLTGKTLRRFGIKRKAGYRALLALEKAGLIKCDRKHGRCPIITVLEAPSLSNGNGKEGSMTGGKS